MLVDLGSGIVGLGITSRDNSVSKVNGHHLGDRGLLPVEALRQYVWPPHILLPRR